MNAIKKFFLNYKNERAAKKQAHRRQTLNYGDVKLVGVLFMTRNPGMHKYINDFVKGLIAEGKEIRAMTYAEATLSNPYDFRYHVATEKSINLFGNITSPEINEFINTEFDYLYCLCVEELEIFDAVLTRSKAKCRIGKFREEKITLFELMINLKDGQDVDKLTEEVTNYTRALVYN